MLVKAAGIVLFKLTKAGLSGKTLIDEFGWSICTLFTFRDKVLTPADVHLYKIR